MDQDAAPIAIQQSFEQAEAGIALPKFVRPAPRCPKREAGEIVVCAQDPETFRLRPPTAPDSLDVTPDTMPQARLPLGEGASLGAEVERHGVGGYVSNRVMIRGRVKF